jgi:hypothetical protein
METFATVDINAFKNIEGNVKNMLRLHVRCPSLYLYCDNDEDMYRELDKSSHVDPMETIIYQLMHQHQEGDGPRSFTRDEVKSKIKSLKPDTPLLSLLLSRVGALDHIVERMSLQGAWDALQVPKECSFPCLA